MDQDMWVAKNPAFSPYSTSYSDYKAYWLGRAAKLAYDDEATIRDSCQAIGLKNVEFIGSRKTDTQVLVAWASTFVVVSFRGTEIKRLKDLGTDVRIKKNEVEWGHVHRGFYRAWNSVKPEVNKVLAKVAKTGRNRSVWITGHSLGGALASVAAMDRSVAGLPVDGVYTFGEPRVFGWETAARYNVIAGSRSFRFVNNNDTVTRVAPRAMGYSHVGNFKYFDRKGRFHDDIGYWNRFLDRVQGRVKDFLKPGTDGLKDHGMKRYLDKLHRQYDRTRS